MTTLSLRDYFAGQALSGLLASLRRSPDEPPGFALVKPSDGRLDVVRAAYAIADEMVRSREVHP